MDMKNQLALSGEKLDEKVYPQLFHHVGMIYLEAVSNLVKDWRKRWLEKLWKRRDLLLEATPILESTMFSSGKS